MKGIVNIKLEQEIDGKWNRIDISRYCKDKKKNRKHKRRDKRIKGKNKE